MSSPAALALADITKVLYNVVVDARPFGRDHEQPAAFGQGMGRNRFYPKAASVNRHVDLAGAEADPITQLPRNYQASCLINGCTHA